MSLYGRWDHMVTSGSPDVSYSPDGALDSEGDIWMVDAGTTRQYRAALRTWLSSYNNPSGPFGGDQWQVAFRSDGKLVALYLTEGTGYTFLYDTDADTWDNGTTLATIPDGRQRTEWGYGKCGDEMFVIGGRRYDSPYTALLTAYAYNIETDTWRTITYPFSAQSYYGKGTEIDGKLWFWGSLASAYTDRLAAVYDPDTDAWTTLATPDFDQFQQGIVQPVDDARILIVPNDTDKNTWIYNTRTGIYSQTSNPTEFNVALPGVGKAFGGAADPIRNFVYAFDYSSGGTGRYSRGALPDAASDIPFLQANDRYQVVLLADQATSTTTAEFRYWYAGPPSWDHNLAEDTAYPAFHTLDENSTYVPGSVETPFKALKTGQEDQIDGVFVEFYARPTALTEATVTTTYTVGFSCRVEGVAVPGWERTVTSTTSYVTTSGVVVSDTQTYETTAAEHASDTWPNLRSVYLPIRLKGKVRAARVILSDVHLVAIRRIQLMGKTMSNRNT